MQIWSSIYTNVVVLISLFYKVQSEWQNSGRIRVRKQASQSSVDVQPPIQAAPPNVNENFQASSSKVQINQPWPGQENRFPFISQWGPWTTQQIQSGIGQSPFQPRGIQIYPSQAQWYPNSPEYQGFNPAWQNYSNGAQNGQAPKLLYWPPTTTTAPSMAGNGAIPQIWNTWSDIRQQGVSGGLQQQWQNWYQNADIWAQWQEWLMEKQKQRGTYINGPPLPSDKNYTITDDTGRILVNVLAGFVAGTTPRKVAMYNMKTYYTQYRRNYWTGDRFFNLDPQSAIESFHKCSYDLPVDVDVRYEVDNARVNEIVFQCVKYQETCCKLNCCDMQGRPLYYAGWTGASGISNNICYGAFMTSLLLSSWFLLFIHIRFHY